MLASTLRAVRLQRIEGAGLDQRLDRALVDALAVDARAEVEQAAERAALFARRDDGLDRALAGALDGAQPVAHALVVDRLEAVACRG